MKLNKKIIINSAIVIGSLIFIFLLFKIFFYIRISEKDIKLFVTGFVKKSINKAVIFNDSYVDFTGDIILIEPNLSFDADFNDNQSLIKATKAVIKLKFPDIFFGNLLPKNIIIYNGEITIINKNQEQLPQKINLRKILSDNFSGFDNNKMSEFTIHIKDSKINYIDILKDKKLLINFYNTSLDLDFQKDNISFNIYSKILPYKTKDFKHGFVKGKGSVPYDQKSDFKLNLNIENFDTTFINDYLEYAGLKSVSFYGGISSELKVSSEKNKVFYNGTVETANLNLVSLSDQHKFISNENLNIVFKITDNKTDSKIETELLKIFDDNIQINIFSTYNYKPKDEAFSFSLKTNKINLGNLSNNFSPAQGISFSGDSILDLKFSYNLTKDILQDFLINYKLIGLSISKLEKSGNKKIISGLNCDIIADKTKIELVSNGLIRDSKVQFDVKTKIKSLDPFKSDSDITFKSDKLYSSQIFYLTRSAVESIFSKAREDIKRGYEDIFFLQKTAGKIFNNNNINLNVSADKIQLLENNPGKYFSNLNLKLSLNNGVIIANSFSLSGLGSDHEFAASAIMNTDHPFFKIRTAIKDFDLSALSSASGEKADISGKMNASFEYEVSAYRFSNILENSKGDMTVNISDCSVINTDFQKNLTKFFNNSGFSSSDLNSLNFKTLSLSIGQTGENFYIKNFSTGGGNFSINGYGKYSLNDGIDLPLTINIAESDIKTTNAPVLIKGRLFSPDLEITNQKNPKALRLFNID